jgi:hypothetical protein
VAQAESDVDMVLVSPAFEGKDIFQRAEMTKGMHRKLVRRFEMSFDIVLCSVSEWLHGAIRRFYRRSGGWRENRSDGLLLLSLFKRDSLEEPPQLVGDFR